MQVRVWQTSDQGSTFQGSHARSQWQQLMPSEAWVIGTHWGQPEMRWGLEQVLTQARLTSGPKFLLPHSSQTNQGWGPGNKCQNQTSKLAK